MLLQKLFQPIVSSYVYFFAQALATMQWDWSKKWPDLNIDVDQCIFLKVGNKELWCWQNCKEKLWKENFFSPLLSYQLFWFIWWVQLHTSQKRDNEIVELLHCSKVEKILKDSLDSPKIQIKGWKVCLRHKSKYCWALSTNFLYSKVC